MQVPPRALNHDEEISFLKQGGDKGKHIIP